MSDSPLKIEMSTGELLGVIKRFIEITESKEGGFLPTIIGEIFIKKASIELPGQIAQFLKSISKAIIEMSGEEVKDGKGKG